MSRSSFDSAGATLRTNGVQGERLCIFLAETLELWGVAGSVESGEGPLVAIVRAENGTIVWIEQLSDEQPQFRWAVRWRGAASAPGGPREVRPRMCGSLVGVLSALRSALDVDRGTPLRVSPAPAPGRMDTPA